MVAGHHGWRPETAYGRYNAVLRTPSLSGTTTEDDSSFASNQAEGELSPEISIGEDGLIHLEIDTGPTLGLPPMVWAAAQEQMSSGVNTGLDEVSSNGGDSV